LRITSNSVANIFDVSRPTALPSSWLTVLFELDSEREPSGIAVALSCPCFAPAHKSPLVEQPHIMENGVDTLAVVPAKPVAPGGKGPVLVHLYPPGPGLGVCYALSKAELLIGRGDDCDLRIPDNSVSRRHACIRPDDGGYCAIDLGSTNGTFVNDASVEQVKLKDGDTLRVGNRIYRFLEGGNVEAQYHEEIYRLIISDALTGIANKRCLLEFLERELVRSARHHRPLAFVMFDLDEFKGVNDRLGHLGGDHTLRELASFLRGTIRRDELLARYGGEEFGVVLPETDQEGASHMAERLRKQVDEHSFQFENVSYHITISLGIAVTSGDEPMTPFELIGRADDKLYQAKREGRNRVAV
jgi:two-component system, cell cycle response regulator